MSDCTSKLLRHGSQVDAIEAFLCKCRSPKHDRPVVPVLFPCCSHPQEAMRDDATSPHCLEVKPLKSRNVAVWSLNPLASD